MTPSYILWVMGEGGAARWPAADYSSKQNNRMRGHLSLHPSLFLQGDMGRGEPHSLLAVYGLTKLITIFFY